MTGGIDRMKYRRYCSSHRGATQPLGRPSSLPALSHWWEPRGSIPATAQREQ